MIIALRKTKPIAGTSINKNIGLYETESIAERSINKNIVLRETKLTGKKGGKHGA